MFISSKSASNWPDNTPICCSHSNATVSYKAALLEKGHEVGEEAMVSLSPVDARHALRCDHAAVHALRSYMMTTCSRLQI